MHSQAALPKCWLLGAVFRKPLSFCSIGSCHHQFPFIEPKFKLLTGEHLAREPELKATVSSWARFRRCPLCISGPSFWLARISSSLLSPHGLPVSGHLLLLTHADGINAFWARASEGAGLDASPLLFHRRSWGQVPYLIHSLIHSFFIHSLKRSHECISCSENMLIARLCAEFFI